MKRKKIQKIPFCEFLINYDVFCFVLVHFFNHNKTLFCTLNRKKTTLENAKNAQNKEIEQSSTCSEKEVWSAHWSLNNLCFFSTKKCCSS